MANQSYFFDHDYSARNDDKILEMRSVYKGEGYGVFWMIIETMAENENGGINTSLIGGLSLGYGVPKDWLQKFIKYCVEIRLFTEKEGFIFSTRMLKHKNLMQSYSDFGKKGAEKRWAGNRGGNRGGNSPPNAKRVKKESKERKEKEDISASIGVVIFDIENFVLNHPIDYEALCMEAGKSGISEDGFKQLLKKYHLSAQENEIYPKPPLALIAGLKKWILNEKNFSNGTNRQQSGSSGKLGTSEGRTQKAREWGSDFIPKSS